MATILLSLNVVSPSLIQKLRALHDQFDEATEGVIVRREPRLHVLERFLVRQQQAAAQGSEILDDLVVAHLGRDQGSVDIAALRRRPGRDERGGGLVWKGDRVRRQRSRRSDRVVRRP